MKEKHLLITARFLSLVFTPFYLPMMGMLALFSFSYLAILPLLYKSQLILMVYLFTILFPSFFIRIYHSHKWKFLSELHPREQRMVPYVISIISYFLCIYLMSLKHVPHFMTNILLAALIIQVVCAVINVWWKVSTHTAGIGGVTGALLAYATLFAFNPVWWLSGVIIISGLVGTSRIILRQHSLSEVVVGYVIGGVISFLVILFA